MPPVTPSSVRSADGAIGLDDFYAVPETSRFMFIPTRALWPADSVNGILPPVPTGRSYNAKQVTIKPSLWLKQFRRAEQMSWAPGQPEIIEGRLISEGGWRDHDGAHCLNLYLSPAAIVGDASKAGPWIKHLNAIYPDDAEHLCDWFAQRVQDPAVKVNHAILMGGPPGIGKDTILAPVRVSIGPWNFRDITPDVLMESFSPFVKAVILRVNEGRDLGDSERFNRYALYERTKIYAAAPPEVLRCNEKFLPSYAVPNVLGLVITSNRKTDGVYLPADDRRHYVAWSNRTKEDFSAEYFSRLWDWLQNEGGAGHVAAWLAQRDLSAFNPHAPPLRTGAFFDIVNAGHSHEDAKIDDALDELGRPDICSLVMIAASKTGAAMEWLLEQRARRAIPHRMERCGYIACRNPHSERGLWKINGQRQTLYAKANLSPGEQLKAAEAYILKVSKAAGNG